MVKKAISFIHINKLAVALICITSFYISCDKKQDVIYVDHISGEIIVYKSGKQSKLNLNTIISNKQHIEKINFQSGFAIFRTDSTKLILPKQGKETYTYKELLYEFDFSKKNVNQKYIDYITKNIRKSKDKSEENLTTQGAVTRGQSFLYIKNPSINFKIWQDSINFSWRTNLINDSLKIKVINSDQQLVGEAITLPRVFNKKILKEDIGITTGGVYFWQILRINDYSNYNAWNEFFVVGEDELKFIKDSIADKLNLSPVTKGYIINEIMSN